MTTIQKQLQVFMESDTRLMALLPGGVYTHEPKRNVAPANELPTRGSTPNAFEATPPFRIKTCAAVGACNRVQDASGVARLWRSYPLVWFYSVPNQQGKEAIQSAMIRFRQILRPNGDRSITMPNPEGGTLIVQALNDRPGAKDHPNDELDAIFDIERLQINGIDP